MLLNYLGKLTIQILCRYSADVEEHAKVHFKCTDFNFCKRLTVYAECIHMFFYQNLVIVAEYRNDC